MIDSVDALKMKLSMVENLLQISSTQRLSAQIGGAPEGEHPTDGLYRRLKCALAPASDGEAAMVREYVANTHGPTHNTYTLEVTDVFAAERPGEADAHRASLGNRQMLWHGSRLSNWAGILSQGLRIAPPEAPATGYMFGKGLYFADMCSKSANYCMVTRANNKVVVMLCDVALGEMYERVTADYDAPKACKKKGKHSTFGLGRDAPCEDGARVVDGVKWPTGKHAPHAYLDENRERLCAAENTDEPKLLYNEFIVYALEQARRGRVIAWHHSHSRSVLVARAGAHPLRRRLRRPLRVTSPRPARGGRDSGLTSTARRVDRDASLPRRHMYMSGETGAS